MSAAAAKAIAAKFESRRLRMYARAKVAADPVYAAALEQLRGSALPLLDIGCGIGLLAFYLRESGLENPIIGIDTDAEKIRAGAAVAASHYRDVKLLCRDAREPAAFSGNVTLLDVVHYLTDSEQREQ